MVRVCSGYGLSTDKLGSQIDKSDLNQFFSVLCDQEPARHFPIRLCPAQRCEEKQKVKVERKKGVKLGLEVKDPQALDVDESYGQSFFLATGNGQ